MSHCFLPKLREYLCFDEPTAEKRLSVLCICLYEWHFKDKKNGIIISSIEKNMWKNNGYSSKQEYRREWKLSHSEEQAKNQQTINFSYAFFSMHFFSFLNFVILFKQMYIYKMLREKCFRMQNKKNNRTHKPEECRMDRRSV